MEIVYLFLFNSDDPQNGVSVLIIEGKVGDTIML